MKQGELHGGRARPALGRVVRPGSARSRASKGGQFASPTTPSQSPCRASERASVRLGFCPL